MRNTCAMLLCAALVAVSACRIGTTGEIVYTGQNPEAEEGAWIKDPEAELTTRDAAGRTDQTRTLSNRVDIPVLEYAQVSATTKGYALTQRGGYDARYVRAGFRAGQFVEYTERQVGVQEFGGRTMNLHLVADVSDTRFPGVRGYDGLAARAGRDRLGAYSAEETPWAETGRSRSEALRSNSWLEAVRTEDYLSATTSESGYQAGVVQRVIGLHLWKYADRDLVTDAVEITYTIVYYNTNEYDIGPTEILEPVPLYTSFIEGSATLPKAGTSVQFIKREGQRDLLRWHFPQGIRAGETNQMTYKVTVRLDSRYGE
jgi:hypothetical protein